MKTLISFVQKHPILFDAAGAGVLAGLLFTLSKKTPFELSAIDISQIGIILALVTALSAIAYVSMVYTIKRPKIKRLEASSQFHKIPIILLVYTFAIFLAYFSGAILSVPNEFVTAVYAAALARIFWIYWKTLHLLKKPLNE